jgi:uncharacterized membrane protein YraQ (UPF0718 family)
MKALAAALSLGLGECTFQQLYELASNSRYIVISIWRFIFMGVCFGGNIQMFSSICIILKIISSASFEILLMSAFSYGI